MTNIVKADYYEDGVLMQVDLDVIEEGPGYRLISGEMVLTTHFVAVYDEHTDETILIGDHNTHIELVEE